MEFRGVIPIVFTFLIALQFIVIVAHDWLNIPGWTHGRQVQATIGPRKLLVATLVNALFPGLAVGFALYFWDRPKPGFVTNYWIIYCAVTLVSAIAMWYIPYLFGIKEGTKRDYAKMYAGTRQVLTARGDNPRPNLLHLCFHLLFTLNFFLALGLWLRDG